MWNWQHEAKEERLSDAEEEDQRVAKRKIRAKFLLI